MGAVRDAIAAALADGQLTDVEKHRAVRRLKAQALHQATPALPFNFVVGAFSITVHDATFDGAADALILTLSAMRLGVVVPVDNPYVYVNPPTHVPDPTGDYVRTFVDGNGVESTVTYAERPLLALRAMVTDSIREAWANR